MAFFGNGNVSFFSGFPLSLSFFRNASDPVRFRRQPDVQSVHFSIYQLLLLHLLHRVLQGQVRGIPGQLQTHLREPEKRRRKCELVKLLCRNSGKAAGIDSEDGIKSTKQPVFHLPAGSRLPSLCLISLFVFVFNVHKVAVEIRFPA